MIIHLVEPKLSDEYDDWDYDHFTIIDSTRIKDYDRFLKFIKQFKDKMMPIEYKGHWYMLLEYVFVFPEDSDHLPVIRLYVTKY